MRLYTVDLPIYERKCWSFGGESGNLRYLKAADRGSPAAQNHSSVLPVNLLIAVLLYKHIYSSLAMATSCEAVAKIYGQIAELENNRLATYPMEREITLRAVRHGLSTVASSGSSSKLIVDIGGGPGELAFALADEGHMVDLIDLSPDLIRLAQAEQDRRIAAGREPLLRSIGTGNALDGNAFDKDVYDAVLLLGSLYHLLDELERKQAVENALALANPKCGLVFCVFVSGEAHLRDLVTREPERLVKQKKFTLPM